MPDSIRNIKVEKIMNREVYSAEIPGTRDEVLEILKQKHVSGIPIVKNGKIVGIVTRTDLLKNPEEEQIAMLMKRDVITISPDESILSAAILILENNIRRLPVVSNGSLVGIITVADIIKIIAKANINTPISEYVGSNVVSVWDETPLSVVGTIMELADVKAVPLLDSDSELVGVVFDKDLINESVIDDRTEVSNMSSSSDDDEWTWESLRDTLSLYYSVSKIKFPKKSVKQVLKRKGKPETAFMSTTVSDCAMKMKRNKLDQLPVINNRKKLLGIVRDRDLLKSII